MHLLSLVWIHLPITDMTHDLANPPSNLRHRGYYIRQNIGFSYLSMR